MILKLILLFPIILNVLFFLFLLRPGGIKYIKTIIVFASGNIMIIAGFFILNTRCLVSINQLDSGHVLWLLSGFFMGLMLAIKIRIFRQIYKRSKDPDNYHYNYFGKKVYHTGLTRPREIGVFVITIPVFLFLGSYYIAKMINIVLYSMF